MMWRIGKFVIVVVLATSELHAAPKVETVASNLDRPSAVAIQPGTGHVFVAESGAGRIVRILDGKPQPVVTGLISSEGSHAPKSVLGGVSLTFLGKDTLIVVGGDGASDNDAVRLFRVPAADQPAIKVDDAAKKLSTSNGGGKSEAELHALTLAGNALFVTAMGDDGKGWIAKGEIKEGTVVTLARAISATDAAGSKAPAAITTSPRGEVVVGFLGDMEANRDSALAFFSVASGRPMMALKLDLLDVSAIAYSPTPNSQLYALDFAVSKPDEGGLFQLIADSEGAKQVVRTQTIVALERPTALAFGDGGAYVSILGPAQGDGQKLGKLLKVSGF